MKLRLRTYVVGTYKQEKNQIAESAGSRSFQATCDTEAISKIEKELDMVRCGNLSRVWLRNNETLNYILDRSRPDNFYHDK